MTRRNAACSACATFTSAFRTCRERDWVEADGWAYLRTHTHVHTNKEARKHSTDTNSTHRLNFSSKILARLAQSCSLMEATGFCRFSTFSGERRWVWTGKDIKRCQTKRQKDCTDPHINTGTLTQSTTSIAI